MKCQHYQQRSVYRATAQVPHLVQNVFYLNIKNEEEEEEETMVTYLTNTVIDN